MRSPRNLRLATALVAGLTALTLAAFTPGAASASTAESNIAPAATGQTGWLRLGHLSPDTKSVDVRVAAVSGGSTLFELAGVAYGDVSPYSELPAGSYTVSMVPAGASGATVPVISATISIGAGTATTVAAYGPTASLQVRAFTDDLTQPAAGNARIRLIQASTLTATVDVATSTGTSIAKKARAGSATDYAEIAAGDWMLKLTGGTISDTANVSVAPGSVTTLFVLDTAGGGLTILPVVDSASVGFVPVGSVSTGGGYLATQPARSAATALTAAWSAR